MAISDPWSDQWYAWGNGAYSLLSVQNGMGENHTMGKAFLLLLSEWFLLFLRLGSRPGKLLLAVSRPSNITG